uniref:Uncharacterized protein n=1 Tax=Meloidogyne enterolobii TaxID=390850 RepID=A0A6V7TZ49_MELEN|nr:unnamed protein product [Meloidogyne enterolobii]
MQFNLLLIFFIIFINVALIFPDKPKDCPELPKNPKKPKNPKLPSNPKKPNPPINDGNNKVVKAKYTEKDTCLSESKANGPIKSNLNKPINGKFTFYGTGGRGACGYDMDEPKFSAAASGSLFNSSGQWVESCFKDKRYVLNDPICMSKCVKITYKCVGCSAAKTLTVPINNKCPECAINHVDLSTDAFNYLEPKGGIVGVAKDASITYIKC